MRAIRQTALALLTALFIQLLALSILLLLLMWPGLSALPRRHDYTEALAPNWNISLPQSGACVYERDSGPSFHGDGERYHVLEYPACTALSYALPWQSPPYGAALEEAKALLESLAVPLEERPAFALCRWYTQRGHGDSRNYLYLFTNASASRLYVLESFFRPGLPGGSRRPFRPAPVRRK